MKNKTLTPSVYKNTPETQFLGRKCTNVVPLSNGLYRIPAGVTWTIKRKWNGFDLESDPCSCCGISIFVTRVKPEEIGFLEQASFTWLAPVEKIQCVKPS